MFDFVFCCSPFVLLFFGIRSCYIGSNTLLRSPQLLQVVVVEESGYFLLGLNHLPCILVVSCDIDFFNADDKIPESAELAALQWLGEVICDNVQCRAVLHVQFLRCNSVGHKEISYAC